MASTVRPSTRWANLLGNGTLRSRRRCTRRTMRRPTSFGTRPRRTVSTSGSSGMLRCRPYVPRLCPTVAKQGSAHANMGGAQPHRRLVVGTHAHAELGKTVACRHFGQQGEMHRRLLFDRWDAHQSDDGQLMDIAAGGDETIHVARQDTRLLRLLACVDL